MEYYAIKNYLGRLSKDEQTLLADHYKIPTKTNRNDILWLLAILLNKHTIAEMPVGWKVEFGEETSGPINEPYPDYSLKSAKEKIQQRDAPVISYWYETAPDLDPERKEMLLIIEPDADRLVMDQNSPFVLEHVKETMASVFKNFIEKLWTENRDQIRIPNDYPKYDINTTALNEWVKTAGEAGDIGMEWKSPGKFSNVVKQFADQLTYVSFKEFEKNLYEKKTSERFLDDIPPLLRSEVAAQWDPGAALALIQDQVITRLPGNAWKGEGYSF